MLALGPTLAIVVGLFGGGLVLGALQSLGYFSVAGMEAPTRQYIEAVLTDPDLWRSTLLTLYVAGSATVIAAVIGLIAAVAIDGIGRRHTLFFFVFQIPLTIPHLVIAVSMLFLLAPSGLMSRIAAALGMIESAAQFPLLVNDAAGIGMILTYVWKEAPFIALMVLSVLKSGVNDLLDVGRTLNAGPWQRWRMIMLPMITPALGAACLIVFAYNFAAFETPYLLGRTYPMLLPVWAWRQYSDVDMMARPSGIATGLLIASMVIAASLSAVLLVRLTGSRRGESG